MIKSFNRKLEEKNSLGSDIPSNTVIGVLTVCRQILPHIQVVWPLVCLLFNMYTVSQGGIWSRLQVGQVV